MKTEKRAPYDANPVLKIETKQNGRMMDSRNREQISHLRFITPKFEEPITIRAWMSESRNASMVYASIWFHDRTGQIHGSGSGSAGGYGYHKESAAINGAFRDAGVTLKVSFGGCGDSSVRIAIESLARKLGYRSGKVL